MPDDIFDRYLLALRKVALAEKTEHTDRAALEGLLGVFAGQANGKPKVQHEPKRIADKGAPDFKVTRGGLILGYVENKAVGENLDKVRKSDQIKKYQSLSQNIILTDYLRFIWIGKDGVLADEFLCRESNLEDRKFRLREDRIAAVSKLLQGFFSSAPEGIGRAQQLALALATRSRLLRDYLDEELIRQEKVHQEGRLYGLFQTFRDQIFHDLTVAEFADAFAQMLAYGLFLARLNAGERETITLNNAREHVPGAFRLIRELVDFLGELAKEDYREVRWVVEEVLSIVNALDLPAIHEDLSFRQRKAINRKVRAADEEEHRLFERDPFIYFYEDYLKAYDKDMRKGRGVYYTPPPVVNFIVRAVDDILKDSFGIKDGLADHKRVTVLDFACGTGTFLLEVFQRIFDNIGGADSGRADLIVRKHMLKNLYGFEYLIAPYTIAHLKLSQFLADRGHPLKDKERLQVFLTNTLEPIEPQRNLYLPAITEEVKAAQEVKDKPILVITGNPPYSGHSKNKGEWISRAIDGYKFTIEKDEAGREEKKPLGERNPKWLNDDYVKFIRFAQLKMDAVEEGIVGIITNHSWLDNPTFRGMRQSLMRSFEQIYVLDLHGNAKKKERAPDGSKDENVFDIEQGVAISIFVKRPGLERGVWRGDLWGKRLVKYIATSDAKQNAVRWGKISPQAPQYLFLQQNDDLKAEYDNGWNIKEMFSANSVGIVTARDHLSIHFEKDELMRTVRDFASRPVEESRELYKLGKDVRDWRVEWAQNDLQEAGLATKHIAPILYHPFDTRWTYYTGRSRGFHCYPRNEVMQHMLRDNIAILTNRSQEIPGEWSNILVVDQLATHHTVSNKEVNTIFPIRVAGRENFSADFRAFLDARYAHHYTPEEVLGCVYAVLNAPAYRVEYIEFLRRDFPRIPFPESADDFEALSKLGWALIQTHLLHQPPPSKLAQYHGKGDHTVEAVRYSPVEQAAWINQSQCFKPVPDNVWNFHIGGYQVLEKYLKSRKSRTLSLDEINHVGAVAGSLAFTLQQMEKIDQAYRTAFPDRG
ncbi:MAG TPA: type ISP restriction/modification enzyme [Rhizomicrobium sp.]|nr:type ISP restriction/modification enzyme [Rhizomicrobium sp.]